MLREEQGGQLAFGFKQRYELIERTRGFLLDELEWTNARGRSTASRKGLRWSDGKGKFAYSAPGNLFNSNEEHVLDVLKEAGVTDEDLEKHGSELAKKFGTLRQTKTTDGRVLKLSQKAMHEAAATVLSRLIPSSKEKIRKANVWGGNHWMEAILERQKLLKQIRIHYY
ncbi:MAG: hypothetical protein WC607_02155 [Candidatus Micrarchaeia archaeon]